MPSKCQLVQFAKTGLVLLGLLAVPENSLQGQITKSLVIGVDGLGFGTHGLDIANTPAMDSLISGTWQPDYRGAYSSRGFAGGVLGSSTQQSTVSGPGWTTMLTGVWTDRHGVTGNGSSFANGDFANNPPYLGIVKSFDPTLVTASFVNWEPIDNHIISSIDNDGDPNNDLNFRGTYGSDQATAQAAQFMLQTSFDPDVVFVSMDEVDIAGHQTGGSSLNYQQTIERIDGYIGNILTTIANRPNFENEYWQIIVTSDHGHRPGGGHGGQTGLERAIPFIISSRTLRQGNLGEGVSHADILPSVLDHFNVPIPQHIWGTSRNAGSVAEATIVEIEDFENLNLQPFSVANGGDGTDWTNQIRTGSPEAWTIDNSGMSGTTSEGAYFGWTALDVQSWTNQQGTQIGRSSLGSPGNTALVADPDAWDDFTTGATQPGFHSFIERRFDLSGVDLNSFELTFDYEFVAEDTQKGTVEISFDEGNTWQTMLEFDSTQVPANTFFVGPARLSSGNDFQATSPQMLFRIGCFDASNDWWFAVDNVAIQTTSELVTLSTELNILKGELTSGDLNALSVSDDADINVRRNPSQTDGEIQVELTTTSPKSHPQELALRLESAGFFRNQVIQSIEFFNFELGQFESVAANNVSRFFDSVLVASASENLSRYVELVTQKTIARVTFASSVRRQNYSVSIDEAIWLID